MKAFLFVPVFLVLVVSPALARTSGVAYVIRKGDTWTLGTAKVERILRLTDGKFFTSSWKDKTSGRDLLAGGSVSDELGVVVGGRLLSGSSGGWKLLEAAEHKLTQGEIQLDIQVQREDLEVTKSYVVYPGSSIIREWLNFKNVSGGPLQVSEPTFLNLTSKPGPPGSVDFYWMTGGEARPGSWMLKKEQLRSEAPRAFDSYDPFGGTAEGNFIGDGVLARVLRNEQRIWPSKDGHDDAWQKRCTDGCASPIRRRACPCEPRWMWPPATSSLSF